MPDKAEEAARLSPGTDDNKKVFKYRKTRYRGLVKQTEKLHMMFALANLYLADKHGLLA